MPGPTTNGEDTGKVQSIGVRFAHGEITLQEAAEAGCRSCASPGGGCQFLGTAATSQVVGEALGLSLTHSALAPSGQPIWLDMARRSARALLNLEQRNLTVRHIVTDAAPGDYKLTAIVLGIVKSDPFQMRRAASPAVGVVTTAARN